MKQVFVLLMIMFVAQTNEPPQVKITTPAAGSIYTWNTPLRYSVSVSDKEDGDTKYNEIEPKQILLEARVVTDTTNVVASERSAIHAMMASNSMQCHEFNGKLIGPSFVEISSRYSGDQGSESELVKRVREGSRGKWGDVVMPTHPELSDAETRKMVQWILSYTNPDELIYLTGTEGVLNFKKPTNAAATDMLVLTASYADKENARGEFKMYLGVK